MTTPYTPGDREFEGDFDTPESVRSEVDLTRRPDAIILNPLVSYSMGPVALGDASAGPQDRPWRVRATETDVYVSRATDANDAWEAETLLFSYAGDPIVEVDIAFEQAGRALVCAERAGHVWIYWFDPVSSSFVFEDFGEGRNPRCLLDNPPDTTDSDILVFYISEAGNVGLVFRQQRDRYQTEYTTPVVVAENRFAQRIVKLRDSRIAVITALHDPLTGQYVMERLESTLYPYIAEPDPTQALMSPQSGILASIIAEHVLYDIDETKALLVPQSGILADLVILHTLYDSNDSQSPTLVPQSGLLVVIVLEHTLYDPNESQGLFVPLSGVLVTVVIEHTLYDANESKALLVPQSGLLV